MRRRAYLASVQGLYGDNAYLPYSVGLLWAYAEKFPEVLDDWELGGLLYQKEPIKKALSRLEEPHLLALSSYVWNWEWNIGLARAVKQRWPSCHVLVGGPHVQENSGQVLVENSSIDLAIYGEGEGAFADLLRGEAPKNIGSMVYREGESIVVNQRREQVDVDELSSPYLDGTFDSILDESPRWQIMQETNRGCPYACTFCAWGTASQDKVRKLPLDRVLAELDWAADQKATYIENCDANFGILKRDEEIVDHMLRLKRNTGFPQRFRCAWAKNTNDRVFSMARKLHEGDMLKAVTLSVQSMDENTLVLAKRKNVKYDKLSEFVELYGSSGIPTYTELILGLPGETFETFIAGIDKLLDASQHDGLFVYPCMILPNTEMFEPAYREEHGIKTVTRPAMLLHGIPDSSVEPELQEYVIATKTMPHFDWLQAYLYSWTIQVFHVLGLTQHIARSFRASGMPYSKFYGNILRWLQSDELNVAESEFRRVRALLGYVIDTDDGSWTLVDERFGPMSWPPEEFSFLQIACESERFYDELRKLLGTRLVEEQRALFVPPEPGKEAEYAREAVWYGRKGSGAKLRKRSAA